MAGAPPNGGDIMLTRPLSLTLALGLLAILSVSLRAQEPILGASYPALSADGKVLAFVYRGDIWTVPVEGGRASRVTIHTAYEYRAQFSPDSKWIAFTSTRDGGYDVYVVAAEGGKPKRLTFHSERDYVTDWTPDGKQIVFLSTRNGRFYNMYTVDVESGRVVKLVDDPWMSDLAGRLSPDAKTMATMRGASPYGRKRYDGSGNYNIYGVDLGTKLFRQLTRDPHQEMWPNWSPDGQRIYYVREKDGVLNLWVMNADGRGQRQVTRFDEGRVYWPNSARDVEMVAFEHMGRIWVYEPGTEPRAVDIIAPSDDKVNKIENLTLRTADEVSPSPDGKKLIVMTHGDLFLIKNAEKGGEAEQLTNTVYREGGVVWSPDSSKIAFTASKDGLLNAFEMDLKSREIIRLTEHEGVDEDLSYSPDGKRIYMCRGPFGLDVVWVPSGGGKETALGLGEGINDFVLSPDGVWIAYSKDDLFGSADVWIREVDGGEAHNVTQYPGNNVNVQWSDDGKLLAYASSRTDEYAIYKLPLEKEKTKFDDEEEEKPEKGEEAKEKENGKNDEEKPPTKIDFDDIEYRSARLTSLPNTTPGFGMTPDGKTVYFSANPAGTPAIYSVPTRGGQPTVVSQGEMAPGFAFTKDGKKGYYLSRGRVKYVKPGGTGEVGFTAYKKHDVQAEIAQMFQEAWWGIKTYFYDANLHGVDWDWVYERYQPIAATCYPKEELYNVVTQMLGELGGSHLGIWGGAGDVPATGLTGALYDTSHPGPGAKVLSVLKRTPTDKEESRIEPGEYIVAVDGEKVRHSEHLHELMERKAGRTVVLTVAATPDGEGREVKMKPISPTEWTDLFYRNWVEERRRIVEERSGGRLTYIHIKAMDRASLARFERELFGHAQKFDGVVLDVRFNGGGRIHDDLLGILRLKVHAYERPRGHTEKAAQPFRRWDKPAVCLINEASYSDAEIFPSGFRYLRMGKLVGVPTNGSVIGTYNIRLIDGSTTFRLPVTGWWTADGVNLENGGVEPDLYVPVEGEFINNGRDIQLEKAVDTLMRELK
jgi:tricorn protease